MNDAGKILVTGASGQLGKLVIQTLLETGQKFLVAATRTPSNIADLYRKGVEVRKADFKIPSKLTEALAGVDKLLLISTAELGARVQDHQAAIDAAVANGVHHIVYTSFPNPASSPAIVARDHAMTEAAIRASGLRYTFLRNYPYTQNLMMVLPNLGELGTLHGCAGSGRCAFVTRRDCARAAAAALLGGSEVFDCSINVSGPRAYSYSELVAAVSEITGRELVYEDLTPEDYKSVLEEYGFAPADADVVVSFDLAMKQGDFERVSDAVEILTGSPATALETLLRTALT